MVAAYQMLNVQLRGGSLISFPASVCVHPVREWRYKMKPHVIANAPPMQHCHAQQNNNLM